MRDGWQIKKVGDFSETINGLWTGKKEPFISVKVYTMTNFTKESDLNPNINPREITASVSQYDKRKLQYGDILIEKSGGGPNQPVGRAVIFNIKNNENNTFSNFTTRLRIIDKSKDIISSEYLHKYLKFIYLSGETEKFQKNSTNIRNLQLKEYLQLEIPVPSLKEQKEIVSILDDAFASIDKAKANIERNIENAKELFQSKLNELFSQTGEGWDKKTLGELGKVCMCKRIMKHQTSPEGDIPFFKIGTFGKSPNAFIDNETYISFKEKYSFPKVGDILISASGTIGRRVIYDGEPAYFQDSNIVWIDNNEELVSNDYLFHFYGVCNWNPSKGATISRLYNADLRRIEISFPNIKTQKILVEKMVALQNNFEAIQLSYEVKLKNLTELKKSILQKAFSGELTNKSVAA